MSGTLLLAALVVGCPQQKEVLEHAATAIEKSYVTEDGAAQIAQAVREWARLDRYADACGDWKAFSSRLHRDLDAYDGHFYLERIAGKTDSGDDWLVAWRAEAIPTNAGIREVRVYEGNIGYIRLSTFYSWEIAKAKMVNAFELIKDSEGLILDLRQNGGGDAETANQVVRAFLGDEVKAVQRIESRNGAKPDVLPKRDMPLYGRGLVVLVDRRSGSAAEYVAYSLQAAGRAKVVGARSGGVANMMDEPEQLPHGFEISIPNARPVNEKTGKNWEGAGVIPDVGGGDDPIYVARRVFSGDAKAGSR